MYLFSEQHAWQGNKAVQQILVFSFHANKANFDKEMEQRLKKVMDGYAGVDPTYETRMKNDLSDSNAGAVFKLRGVKNSTGNYAAVIRCGFTGALIWEDYYDYITPELALVSCMKNLKQSLEEITDTEINKYSTC